MKRLVGVLLIMAICNFSFGLDSLKVVEAKDSVTIVNNIEDTENSLQKQAEEIPVVFAQWWFWVGLLAIIAFLKFVLFKK